jgi:paraquat-inducible protein B
MERNGNVMKKEINPTRIGIFVVGAIVLTVTAVIVFGSGRFFAEKETYVSFFEGSVFGLNQGAAVVCRGVRIGSVTDIKLLSDPDELKVYIAVLYEIEPKRFHVRGGRPAFEHPDDRIDQLIKHGLRIHLEQQSFLTRQMMLVIDFHPDTEVNLVGIETRYPEIPTIKSGMQELLETLETLPLQEIANSIRDALKGIEEVVHSPEVTEGLDALKGTLVAAEDLVKKLDKEIDPVMANLDGALVDARKLLKDVDAKVDPLATSLDEILESARLAVVQAEGTIANLESTTREDSPLVYELTTALAELSAAARSLRVLAEYLEQHPEALLRGKGGSGGK